MTLHKTTITIWTEKMPDLDADGVDIVKLIEKVTCSGEAVCSSVVTTDVDDADIDQMIQDAMGVKNVEDARS